jgi:hypothetical protein
MNKNLKLSLMVGAVLILIAGGFFFFRQIHPALAAGDDNAIGL